MDLSGKSIKAVGNILKPKPKPLHPPKPIKIIPASEKFGSSPFGSKLTDADINLFKSVWDSVSDWSNVTLGSIAQKTKVPVTYNYSKPVATATRTQRYGDYILPPATYADDFEAIRLGKANKSETALKWGMAKERYDRPGKMQYQSDITFNKLYNNWLKNVPDDIYTQGGKARKYELPAWGADRKHQTHKQAGPIDITLADEAIKMADANKTNVDFSWKLDQAIKQILGVEGRLQAESGTGQKIGQIKRIVAIMMKNQKRKEKVHLPQSSVQKDIQGNITFKATQPDDVIEAFNQIPIGDVVKGKGWQYMRDRIDINGKFPTMKKRIFEDNAVVKGYLDPLKAISPKDKLNRPIPWYQLDHVRPPRFGGDNSMPNLRIMLLGEHAGPTLKTKMVPGLNDVKTKSRFEDDIFEATQKMIHLVAQDRRDEAMRLKQFIKGSVNNFKKTFPEVDFAVGDIYQAVKTGDKEAKMVRYVDVIKLDQKTKDLLKNDFIVDYKNLPNKGQTIEKQAEIVANKLQYFADQFGGMLPGRGDDVPGIPTDKPLSQFVMKEGGLVRPNMAYGGDMAQFTEMESVLPDLNPAEAGMEDYVQLAMSIPKFKNPFKKVDPPPIMSDAASGLQIADKTKKGAKVQGTIGVSEGQTPIFHLKSDTEIANAVQDKMTPQQWFGYLTKKGVSPTEMHEFGLGNLLKNIGGFDEGTKKWKSNVPITKSELISQYKNNKPVITYKIQQIEPFDKGFKDFQSFLTGSKSGGQYLGDLPSSARNLEEIRNLRHKPQDITGDRLRSTIVKFMTEVSDRAGRDLKKAWPEIDPQITSAINKIIKDAYGIENVIENGFGNMKVPFYTQNLVNRFKRLKKGEGFYMGKTGVGHEGAQFLDGGTGYIEIPFTYNPNPKGMRANEPRFKFGEGHFTNPEGNNPTFWLRASERVDEAGERTFLIEEIQSDMHQKVKQKPDTFTYAPRHDTPEFINKTFSLNQVKKLKDDLIKVSDQIDKITGHTDPSAMTVMERLKVKREALRNQIREAEDLISQAVGKSDEIFPEGPWKKSENQVKVAIKTLINLATQEGFDNVAIITAKAKNHAVGASQEIAKGNRGFYDGIAPSAMKNVAKNLDLEFSSTNIKDGKGNTWAKIPIIKLKKESVKASVDMYKSEGGYIYRPSFVDVVPAL